MISEQDKILEELKDILIDLRKLRPEERSELSRHYAVVITDLEKDIAYFEKYIVGEN